MDRPLTAAHGAADDGTDADRLQSLFDLVLDPLWDWDVQRDITTFSAGWFEMLGLEAPTRPGAVGPGAWERVVHQDDLPIAVSRLEDCLAGRTPHYEAEYRVRTQDGRWLWVRSRGRVVSRDERGKALRMVGSLTDITGRRALEERLAETDRFLGTLMSNLPGWAYRCRNDPAWTFEFVSEGVERITGYAVSRFKPRGELDFADIIHPDDRARVWEEVQSALRQRQPFQLVYRILAHDGRVKWLWEQGRAVLDAAGEVVALEGFISDITEFRRTELTLREAENRFTLFMENSPAVAWIKDEHGRYVYVNRMHEQLLGKSRNEVCGLTDEALWPPETAEEFKRNDRLVLQTDQMLETQEFLPGDDEEPVQWMVLKFPIRNEEGERFVGGLAMDVSERARAEQALKSHARRQQAAAELGLLALSGAAPRLLIREFVSRTAEALGAPLAAALMRASDGRLRVMASVGWEDDVVRAAELGEGVTHAALTFEQDAPVVVEDLSRDARLRDPLAGAGAVSGVCVPLSGAARPRGVLCVHSTRRRAFTSDEVAFIQVVGNLLAMALHREQVESELRQREHEFKALVERAPDMIARFDRDLRHIYANPAVEHAIGLPRESVLGRTIDELQLPEPVRAQWRRSLLATFQSGRETTLEFEYPHETGPEYFESRLVPEFDESGAVETVLAASRNITPRKRAEAELKTSSELRRLLLRELDHRVRNNLASLAALIDISSRGARSVEQFAASIQGRVQAMAAVHSLLSRGHSRTLPVKRLIQSLVPADLAAAVALEGPDFDVSARQGTALGMVVQELIANSLKYGSLGAGGRITASWSEPTAQGRVDMNWRETGGPPVQGTIERGVGTALITGLVRAELRGEARLNFDADGVNHTLRLRLDPTDETDEAEGAARG